MLKIDQATLSRSVINANIGNTKAKVRLEMKELGVGAQGRVRELGSSSRALLQEG